MTTITSRKTRHLPILWKYLIKSWLSIFGTALLGIIVLLLSTKLDEVARFISLGASVSRIVFFILLQIPYVLQIALPISGCLAGFLLFMRLSENGELVAARSVGYSLTSIIRPILLTSCIGSLLMFGWVFDLSARSHLAAKKLEHDVRAEEPLAMVQSSQFLGNQCYSLELEGSLRTGGAAKNLIICFQQDPEARLKLFLADTVHNKKGILEADNFLALSTEKPKNFTSPSTLIIEQAEHKQTPTTHMHEFVEKKHWKVNPDHCPMTSVWARIKDLNHEVAVHAYQESRGKNSIKEMGKYISEPFRRFSLSLALTTLTFTAMLAGIFAKRRHGKERFILPIVLFGFYMACYLAGKNMDELPIPSILCYLLPHPLLLLAASQLKKQAELGIV